MHRISDNQIRQVSSYSGLKSATSINEFCPHCCERGNFSVGSGNVDVPRRTVSGTAKCPGCNAASYFWSINTGATLQVFMHPSPKLHEKMQASEIPEPIARSYNSCVDAFNSRNFTATAVLCRRTLEGLFKTLLGADGKGLSLHNAIRKVSEKRDLALPLRHLADAVRQGGNLGAHFDEEREPSPELARAMVELVEYIINFIHVLPERIEDLNRTLSSHKPSSSSNV